MMKPSVIRPTLHIGSSEDKSDASINVRHRDLPMLARARNLLINTVLMRLRTEIDNPVLMRVWPRYAKMRGDAEGTVQCRSAILISYRRIGKTSNTQGG